MGFNSGLKGLKKNYGNPRRPVTRLWLREYEKKNNKTPHKQILKTTDEDTTVTAKDNV